MKASVEPELNESLVVTAGRFPEVEAKWRASLGEDKPAEDYGENDGESHEWNSGDKRKR